MTITQHTTTIELGVIMAETLSDQAVRYFIPGEPRPETTLDPHGLAIAAVRAIEATELVINSRGLCVFELPDYERRLQHAMIAAVWVTGIPEDQLRNTEEADTNDTAGA
jgi:hypothetical protein